MKKRSMLIVWQTLAIFTPVPNMTGVDIRNCTSSVFSNILALAAAAPPSCVVERGDLVEGCSGFAGQSLVLVVVV